MATGAVNLAGGLKVDVVEYYNTLGTWPASNAEAGAASATSILGKYVESVTVTDGKITAAFCTNGDDNDGVNCEAAQAFSSQTLTLSPSAHGGSIVWTCSVSSADIYDLVPANCRHN
ncbi:MAG: pilin [Gammaproteobacteria bacterium]|nr:pilin [Gammaproteobacteria bacterium]